MGLNCYSVDVSANAAEFDFVSSGPNGEIANRIRYDYLKDTQGTGYYNLAFGKLVEDAKIDDKNVSNNGDTEIILSTVAQTAVVFTDYYGNPPIFFKGACPARQRLYRMLLTKYWNYICEEWQIQGLIDGKWELFEKDRNYEAFFAFRKQSP
jgi:hypothetical protein